MITQPNDDQLADLARLVGSTADEEIDCDEMLNRVAAYLKALTESAAPTEALQQVAQHLKICPECREEFAALIEAEGLDPEKILPS